ncbi:MAG TPA: sulfotransferase domain-containing protein [Planctomycetaceae bacterium]|jgi:hypothetical protein|nr:sulfotransferase domain-containing protein [Planctomycetaceae bacterium]
MKQYLTGIVRRFSSPQPQPNGSMPTQTLPEGLTAIDHVDPNDVIIAGYPKSGNTWVQVLVSGVVYGVSPSLAPDSLVQDLVPDVHSRKFYRRYQTPMFFKSHDLPRPEYRRVVYLLRDGRDVMVSYFHHLRALGSPDLTMESMVESGEGVWPCHWDEHVRQWTANPYSAELITIKYEELLSDPVAQLQRFCDFAKLTRSLTFLESIAAAASFEKMKQRERQMGWENSAWPKDSAFVRRGKAGGYRDEFPQSCLSAFEAKAGEMLKASGYT